MTGPGASFAEVLDAAVDRRGLSLGAVRHRLRRRGHDLSIATLSYWRRGHSLPTRARSLDALATLEEVLKLPVGALSGTLERRRDTQEVEHPGIDDLAASLGLSWLGDALRSSVHDRIVLDAAGRPVSHQVRQVMTAQAAGFQRYPVAYWIEGDEAEEARIEARGNCVVERSVRNDRCVVAEVVLPRPLEAGESWMTEISLVLLGDLEPMVHWGRCVTSEVRLLHVAIAFHPDRLPLGAESVVDVGHTTTRAPLVLPGPSLDLHFQDFGPADVGIHWNW
ncbi:hypothetical protein [Mobilicoccus massiliensis]|uniref:hypothetical protein n=1 Tax=Mobilicoccus massiliensis TaxID=1522310 RepID=UPI000694E9A2|nr:hypothetical protein [Mobilicoccus massiliensis]